MIPSLNLATNPGPALLALLEDDGTCHLSGEALPCWLCYHLQLPALRASGPGACSFLTLFASALHQVSLVWMQ